MIAAAAMPCDALDGGGQIAIAVRDQGRELVDLIGRFGRRLDLHPAADAVEDGCWNRREVEVVGMAQFQAMVRHALRERNLRTGGSERRFV